MSAIACPSCNKEVSDKAFDCPHCGHPLRKPKRGFFGKIFKWLLILFNVVMLIWLISYISTVSGMYSTAGSRAAQSGTAVGGTLGVGFLLMLWVIGDIILGLIVLLTRPRR